MRARVRFAPAAGTGVIEAGVLVDKSAEVAARVFPAWCLVLVTAGGGGYRWPGARAAVGAGDLLVVVPDERHAYGPDPAGAWSEIFLTLAGPVADAVGAGLPHVLPARAPAFRREFARIADEFIATGHDPGGVLLARLHLLLASAASAPADDGGGWLRSAQALLAARPERPLAPAAVARAVGMEYRRFRRDFRRAVGMPPAAYRLHCRLAEARRLLIERPDLPLADIAAATGFCSAFQFSRIFRRHHGVPPSRERRGSSDPLRDRHPSVS